MHAVLRQILRPLGIMPMNLHDPMKLIHEPLKFVGLSLQILMAVSGSEGLC